MQIINKSYLIQKYLVECLSGKDIAKSLDISATTIYNYMKKYNIKRRNSTNASINLYLQKPKTIEKQSKVKLNKNNPFYGRHHTEKTKEKIRLTKIGSKNPMYNKRKELSPTWRGGIAICLYPLGWTKTLKYNIRKRDNYICRLCNIKQTTCYRALDIHHIDYCKGNLKESNLITLCNKCNTKANFNRDYWYAYYTYIMENIK